MDEIDAQNMPQVLIIKMKVFDLYEWDQLWEQK
jgi:hypothetical protein